MTFTTITIIAGAILLAIFFLIARLAIRWAARLTIVGVILLAVIGVGIFWWWGNRLAGPPAPATRERPPAVRRSPAR
jgi:hypothetical protein